MLRGLTLGSGFAAVSIAGITQPYLKKKKRIRGYGRADKLCLQVIEIVHCKKLKKKNLGAVWMAQTSCLKQIFLSNFHIQP